MKLELMRQETSLVVELTNNVEAAAAASRYNIYFARLSGDRKQYLLPCGWDLIDAVLPNRPVQWRR